MKRKVLSLLICTGIFLSIFGAPVALAAEDGKHYIMYDEDMENGDLYEVLSSISVTSGKQGKLSLVSDPLNASNRVMRINGDGEQLKLTATAEPYAEGSELSISYKFMKTDDSGWDPMRLYGSGITNGCLIHYTQNGFLYRTHKPNGTENGQAQTITPPVAQRVYTKPNVWYRLEIQYKNIADPNLDNRRYNFYVYEIDTDGNETVKMRVEDMLLFQRSVACFQSLEILTTATPMYIDDIRFTTNRKEEVGQDKYKLRNDYDWLTQDILTQEQPDAVTQNLTLPAEGPFKSKITWSCSDMSVVDVDNGTIYRKPQDRDIILTATMKRGSALPLTKQFSFKVKMAEVSDQEAVNAAAAALSIPNSDTVISDFALPLNGIYNTSVRWFSAPSGSLKILESSGVITRSEQDVTIPIQAVVTRGSASATTSIPITIMKKGFEEALCPIYEEFDGQELGSIWSIDASAGSITQETEGTVTALKLNKSDSEAVISAYADFDSIAGKNILETRFKTDVTGQQILLIGGTFGTAVIFQEDGGRLKADVGGTLYDLCAFNANEWYTAQVVFDSVKGTIAIRVNGAESLPAVVAKDYAFDIMSFGAELPYGAAGSLTIDYVKIIENIGAAIEQTASLLALDYIDSNNITEDFEVPVTGTDGTVITWSSNHPAVSFNGNRAVVTRPEAEQENARLQLTAKISKEFMSTQVQFDARVLRKTTAAEDAQADLDALIIPGIVDAVSTPDLKLVKTGASGSAISYESSDQNVITNAGKVLGIGYAEDQSITLNVRAEKNGSVAEKQFTIIVKSVNLTYDKYATASSNGIGFAAIYAIDQDEETAWLSNDEEMRPSITVDLYQPMKLNQIRLKGTGNGVKSAKLEYSLNNISYQPLLTLTSPGSEMKLFNVDTVQARYLRYTITDKTLESAGLSELQAYYKEDVSSIFDSAVSAITIPNRHSITESFTLPVPPEGYHVTWTSDTPEVIRIEGNRAVVVRKSNDVTVTLTAVLEYDGLTCVKEFDDCRVLGTSSGGSSGGGGGGGGSGIISGNNSSQGSVYLPVENIQNETNRFADVPETHWAYAYIQRLAENGVMNGRSVEYFAPDDPITREEFVKLLIAGFGFSISAAETGFSDVDGNAWYTPYLSAAKKLGIVSGVSETEFGVGMRITREDMAVMIARTAEKKGITLSYGTPMEFADASDISSYATDSVARLSAAGILSGDENGLFTPRGMATRAQAAKIISVLLFEE